ncbi:MAG TPA: hypothetical protein VF540_12815 [Segetibacter sp.]
MDIKLGKKFADKQLDDVIDRIYRNLKNNPSDKYFFDLSEVEYIGNQELLVLSALFKNFAELKVEFKVLFFQPGIDPNKRIKRQIIEIWDVWKIWKTVPDYKCSECFGLDGNTVKRFKKEINYNSERPEIYRRYGVTPFLTLKYIHNYNERDIQKSIDQIYKLNSLIEDLLKNNKCHHPFISKTLSTIITEELYLNFLDHSQESSFPNSLSMAFMSISFHPKLEGSTPKEIQWMKQTNFGDECLEESKNFFFDEEKGKYKNTPYIEFSFLDFGKGIVETLKDQFLRENKPFITKNLDSEILKYSFNHNSSRHPIYDPRNKIEQFIPRGLFDALIIVRRYKGLLVVRSNSGKVLFDFSVDSDINRAFKYFDSHNKTYFPGTLISIYIPAIEDTSTLDISSIKPELDFAKVKPENKKHININTLVEKLNVSKEELYPKLLQELRSEIYTPDHYSLVFISFKGSERIDRRIIKKIIYFLLTDYEINHRNNVVILNSPPGEVIEGIAIEILGLDDALKNYKLHPLPIIDFGKNKNDLNIKWLGIYDDTDKDILNNLIYDGYTVPKSDFNDPTNVTGHLNAFDTRGNLISNFPDKNNIIEFYRAENETITSQQVQELLEEHKCIRKDDNVNLYLCSGNYYQKEYLELNNLVNDKNHCDLIAELLYNKLEFEINNLKDFKFISITTISDKIMKSLVSLGFINEDDYKSIDNYHNLENELEKETADFTKKYILICHAISSGAMVERLNAQLLELGAKVEYIAVITSTSDPTFEGTKSFLNEYRDKIFSLYKYPIAKFMGKQLGHELFSKDIIRINPHTNIPIRLSIDQTNFKESVIFRTNISFSAEQNEITIQNKLLENISEDAIHVGFLEFNNVIHPYFFKTATILKDLSDELLEDILNFIGKKEFENEKIKVFYPRKSGIDFFNFDQLKSVLGKHKIEWSEIERFVTPEGWKFPHNSDYLNAKINKSFCFILDDGSCSGDSLIQMVDEISFCEPKQIVLLCFIGRLKSHKREFFSRLSHMKIRDNRVDKKNEKKKETIIPISIYFASHWHIPTYYLDENPNIKERSWLNEIINLQNTPQSIKKIAGSILKEIQPKNNTLKDHKYLPKIKGTKDKIPKKELLLIREELGKVIGYRLYKESFIFFDSFIKKYEKKEWTKDRYKEIELLCATFIYEPYLYDKIVDILPDVVEKIENFVRVLIFSNEKIYEKLTYEWSKKDIIHLFFIVFKDEKLVGNQKKKIDPELTIKRFKQLIKFTEEAASTTNYILYKLLFYFPLTSDQFTEKKFDKQIKELIANLKDDESISNKEVRKYYTFIASLPSRQDFDSQLRVLLDNYDRQETYEYHLEKKSFDNNISNIISAIRDCVYRVENSEPLIKSHIDSIREKWFAILDFVNPILTFSKTFPDYLIPYSYFNLIRTIENGEGSVRELIGFNVEVIFSLSEVYSDKKNLLRLEENIIKIQLALQKDSTFYQLIKNRNSDFYNLVNNICQDINKAGFELVISGKNFIEPNTYIMIPELYSEHLLKNELVNNIKNHSSKDSTSKVLINITLDNKSDLILKIENKKANKENDKSNLEGIKCLNLMANSDLFYFDYKTHISNDAFIQTLRFKNQNDGYK